MNTEERIAFLKGTAIFEDTPVPVLQKLAPLLSEVTVNPSDDIVLIGDEGDSMFLIIDGRVSVHEGDHRFSTLKRGDGFGAYHLIDHVSRSATVTAEEPTHLLRIPQKVFDDLSTTEPGFSRGMMKTLVKRLRQMNRIEEQLAQLNATKDKFFSIIAHDLRGPLSTIISLSGLLKDQFESLSEADIAGIIRSQYNASWQSLKLLDNLLKWAQLQTGRLIPDPSMVDLDELIRDLVDFLKPSADGKKIRLSACDCTGLLVFADEDMIRTVLLNLANNALKFTPAGGTVTIHCEPSADRVRVAVSDSGVGIAQERVSTLFHLDKTSSTEGTNHEKGTGLGLILCKEFVEKNKGTISVSSFPGKGSTFFVTLPVAQPNQDA